MRLLGYAYEGVLLRDKLVSLTHIYLQDRRRRWIDSTALLILLLIFLLWRFSLSDVQLERMTGLGLVSALPLQTLGALGLAVLCFVVLLQLKPLREPLLLLYLLTLIFMLYGITSVLEEVPRFATVYRHAGYTEYIMRNGTVDPNLDAYFNWPGFFIFGAFLTQVIHAPDILTFAGWAPLVLNLAYLAPLYGLLGTFTTNKRLLWLGLLVFYLGNWIGQDYFSPQGLSFFCYLVILLILLRWFRGATQPLRVPNWRRLQPAIALLRRYERWSRQTDEVPQPCTRAQRIVLLTLVLLLFVCVVASHPLTPFFMIASITALVLLRRCHPIWLPVALCGLTLAWMVIMAQPFLRGHMPMVTGHLGQVASSFSANVTARAVKGSPEHIYISSVRIMMTLTLWAAAVAGCLLRWRRGQRDITLIALAVTPFLLMIVQSYGGEMLLRVYLFALPFAAFFVASLLQEELEKIPLWRCGLVACAVLALLSSFLFTRYGNEKMDYISANEVVGLRYLYRVAPPHSLLMEAWYGAPWQFERFEQFNYFSAKDVIKYSPIALASKEHVEAILDVIRREQPTEVYILFSKSQEAAADLLNDVPSFKLRQLERELLRSERFQSFYQNGDITILRYVPEKEK